MLLKREVGFGNAEVISLLIHRALSGGSSPCYRWGKVQSLCHFPCFEAVMGKVGSFPVIVGGEGCGEWVIGSVGYWVVENTMPPSRHRAK